MVIVCTYAMGIYRRGVESRATSGVEMWTLPIRRCRSVSRTTGRRSLSRELKLIRTITTTETTTTTIPCYHYHSQQQLQQQVLLQQEQEQQEQQQHEQDPKTFDVNYLDLVNVSIANSEKTRHKQQSVVTAIETTNEMSSGILQLTDCNVLVKTDDNLGQGVQKDSCICSTVEDNDVEQRRTFATVSNAAVLAAQEQPKITFAADHDNDQVLGPENNNERRPFQQPDGSVSARTETIGFAVTPKTAGDWATLTENAQLNIKHNDNEYMQEREKASQPIMKTFKPLQKPRGYKKVSSSQQDVRGDIELELDTEYASELESGLIIQRSDFDATILFPDVPIASDQKISEPRAGTNTSSNAQTQNEVTSPTEDDADTTDSIDLPGMLQCFDGDVSMPQIVNDSKPKTSEVRSNVAYVLIASSEKISHVQQDGVTGTGTTNEMQSADFDVPMTPNVLSIASSETKSQVDVRKKNDVNSVQIPHEASGDLPELCQRGADVPVVLDVTMIPNVLLVASTDRARQGNVCDGDLTSMQTNSKVTENLSGFLRQTDDVPEVLTDVPAFVPANMCDENTEPLCQQQLCLHLYDDDEDDDDESRHLPASAGQVELYDVDHWQMNADKDEQHVGNNECLSDHDVVIDTCAVGDSKLPAKLFDDKVLLPDTARPTDGLTFNYNVEVVKPSALDESWKMISREPSLKVRRPDAEMPIDYVLDVTSLSSCISENSTAVATTSAFDVKVTPLKEESRKLSDHRPVDVHQNTGPNIYHPEQPTTAISPTSVTFGDNAELVRSLAGHLDMTPVSQRCDRGLNMTSLSTQEKTRKRKSLDVHSTEDIYKVSSEQSLIAATNEENVSVVNLPLRDTNVTSLTKESGELPAQPCFLVYPGTRTSESWTAFTSLSSDDNAAAANKTPSCGDEHLTSSVTKKSQQEEPRRSSSDVQADVEVSEHNTRTVTSYVSEVSIAIVSPSADEAEATTFAEESRDTRSVVQSQQWSSEIDPDPEMSESKTNKATSLTFSDDSVAVVKLASSRDVQAKSPTEASQEASFQQGSELFWDTSTSQSQTLLSEVHSNAAQISEYTPIATLLTPRDSTIVVELPTASHVGVTSSAVEESPWRMSEQQQSKESWDTSNTGQSPLLQPPLHPETKVSEEKTAESVTSSWTSEDISINSLRQTERSQHPLTEKLLRNKSTAQLKQLLYGLHSDVPIVSNTSDESCSLATVGSLAEVTSQAHTAGAGLVMHEYAEMWSIFRQVPLWLEVLRAEVIRRHNAEPRIARLLARYPSLRPSSWVWITAPLVSDLQQYPGAGRPPGTRTARAALHHMGTVSQFWSYPVQPVIEKYTTLQ